MDNEHADRGSRVEARERIKEASESMKCRLARFSQFYESRDGALAVFEDEHGHLQAVDVKRLV